MEILIGAAIVPVKPNLEFFISIYVSELIGVELQELLHRADCYCWEGASER